VGESLAKDVKPHQSEQSVNVEGQRFADGPFVDSTAQGVGRKLPKEGSVVPKHDYCTGVKHEQNERSAHSSQQNLPCWNQ